MLSKEDLGFELKKKTKKKKMDKKIKRRKSYKREVSTDVRDLSAGEGLFPH